MECHHQRNHCGTVCSTDLDIQKETHCSQDVVGHFDQVEFYVQHAEVCIHLPRGHQQDNR